MALVLLSLNTQKLSFNQRNKTQLVTCTKFAINYYPEKTFHCKKLQYSKHYFSINFVHWRTLIFEVLELILKLGKGGRD